MAAPQNAITDMLATTIEHGTEAIAVEVVFDNLRPRQYLDLTANLTTDGTGSHLPTQATALTYRGESTLDVYTDGRSRCATADDAVAIDYDTDVLTMTVPRRCVGEPRWIEAQVTAATMVYDAPPDDPRADAVWEDDAYRTALHPPAEQGTSVRLYHR
ncbi:hypothetical protein GCM10023339_24630 [Alloalcanivorax gelatiniphagus]